MKKLFLGVLCFILVAASTQAGAGDNSVKQENSRQAGNSGIHFYDVEATNGHGYGRVVINSDEHNFVFIGKDFTPYQEIHLQYEATNGTFTVFAKGRSTPSGNLHLAGTWEGDLPTDITTETYYAHVPINGFRVENDGAYVLKVGCHYTTDVWSMDPAWHECTNKSKNMSLWEVKFAHLEDLGVPLGASVDIKVYVALGPDQTGSQTFTYAYGDGSPGYCYASYEAKGTAINPWLHYSLTECESTPGKGDWWASDVP
jgi:hypothetical protein